VACGYGGDVHLAPIIILIKKSQFAYVSFFRIWRCREY